MLVCQIQPLELVVSLLIACVILHADLFSTLTKKPVKANQQQREFMQDMKQWRKLHQIPARLRRNAIHTFQTFHLKPVTASSVINILLSTILLKNVFSGFSQGRYPKYYNLKAVKLAVSIPSYSSHNC